MTDCRIPSITKGLSAQKILSIPVADWVDDYLRELVTKEEMLDSVEYWLACAVLSENEQMTEDEKARERFRKSCAKLGKALAEKIEPLVEAVNDFALKIEKRWENITRRSK